MKYISVFIIALLISSCCGKKQVIVNTSKDNAPIETLNVEHQNETESETESGIALTTPPENSYLDIEIPEVKDTDTIIIAPFYKTDRIHSAFNILLQEHVSDHGNVHYKNFAKDQSLLRGYIASLGEVMPDETWNRSQKLAYWMNAYNAMTIDLIIKNQPIESIKDINSPWDQRLWKFGDNWYTLNDVEHKIIRKMDEPRIHFALVCAAVSCPRLYNKAFTAKDLETDLELLTRGFLNDPSKNELSQNNIRLSRIFKWYGGDFKNNGKDLIDFLNQYSEVTISSKAKKSYKDYNWSLND